MKKQCYINIGKDGLLLVALYYLYIPLSIFLCSWVKVWIGLPLALLLGACPVWLRRKSDPHPTQTPCVSMTRKQFYVSVAVLLTWVVLSGIGGYVWQNRWDHFFRNAVFNDLVNRPWPVADGGNILTYYIGFWLPPAVAAKMAGAMWVGRLCQLLYAITGILLAFLLTVEKVGNMKLRYLLPFIFFSGLDIAGIFLSGISIRHDFHIELWSPLAFWESNTTLLFWVYNQAVPSWVATMIVLNRGSQKGIAALTLCFLTISAPFSVVGLFPLALFYIIRTSVLSGTWSAGLKLFFTPANILSLLGALPVMIYFLLNRQTETHISFSALTTLTGVKDFFLIILIEVLVFVPFLYRQLKRNTEFYILFLTSLLCLFIHMGSYNDFNSRVELPLNFFMTTQIMIYISHFKRQRPLTRICFLMVSLLAVITPVLEMSRVIYLTIRLPRVQYFSVEKESIFEFELLRNNFVADSVITRSDPPAEIMLFNYPQPTEKDSEPTP